MLRKLLALLLCLSMLVLCGCAASTGGDRDDDDDDRSSSHRNDKEDDDEDDEDRENPGFDFGDDDNASQEEEVPSRVASVTYQHSFDWEENQEFATITAYDADCNVVWELATLEYEISQIDRIAWVGELHDRVYYVEDGAVIALDRETGRQVWKNEEFGGSPSPMEGSCLIAPDGTLYLTGYFGPDLMVVAPNGATVYRADSVHPDYYWPYGLELDGNRLTIILEGGPQGSDRYTVTLDTETWEVME